jgi:Ankyrin repeat
MHHTGVLFDQETLVEGLDVNTITGCGTLGNTALMWACLQGQAAIVSELLVAFQMVDVHAKNKAGLPLLISTVNSKCSRLQDF